MNTPANPDCTCGHPYRHHFIRLGGYCGAVRGCACQSYTPADSKLDEGNS